MLEADDLLGQTIAGKFEIEAVVGAGAMGHVFRARHVTLGTTVAIKIMKGEVAKDPMFRQRFLREAKAASRLEHPCSVRVLDYGEEEDGMVYLAMEFLNGRDLLSVLRNDWPITDLRIVDILVQALGAISVAHGLGIVHRDLKPENIMITTELDDDGHVKDSVKVCDFGIAKMNDPRSFQTDGKSLTTSGMLIGTPEYMSPEQARGDPLDARSDLYSLGVVLYHLLTGRVPFTAENTIGIVLKQVTDDPEVPSSVRAGVNPRLEAICLKALRKNRDERYQTAKEMRSDLRNVFGYKTASYQGDDSGPHIPPVASAREIESAPTLRGGVSAPHRDVDFSPKATGGGTELALPVASHRGIIAGVGFVALLIGIVAAVAFSSYSSKDVEVEARPSATPQAPASELPSALATTNRTSEHPSATAIVTAPVETSVTPTSRTTTTATAGTTARPSASAPAIASTPPLASAEPTSTVPFRPSAANVSFGTLTTERVQKPPISALLSQRLPKLTECYQNALITLGAPVGGSAQIALSIDEQGVIQAIVAAPKHPQFARCAQQVLAGAKVAPSAVDSGGGTASQWLTLNP